MGNPEHLKWLLEGVEAWNARRKREDFVPDLSEMDIRAAFEKTGKLEEGRIPLLRANLREADLGGADLGRADLREANLGGANLRGANLRGTNLRETNLKGANLEGANLGGANLRGVNLRGVNLRGANLGGADLGGAHLREAKLGGAYFGEADVRTVYSGVGTNDVGTPEYTNLSQARALTQAQLDTMRGDTGTILPDGLHHPAHWPDPEPPQVSIESDAPPPLPEGVAAEDVAEKDGRLFLVNIAPPPRSDLETIHGDLREDLAALLASGAFDNISKGLGTALSRYAGIVDCAYADLDQVRFGVQTKALRLKLDTHRQDLSDAAPEKTGDLEAALLSAELIAARLPDWQTFLKETADERSPVAEHEKEITEAIESAAEEMREDPAHFAPALPERVSEYLNTATIEGYLAATALLNNLTFATMAAVRRFTRDVGNETRKQAVSSLAKGVVAALGATLMKFVGILPAEFDWVLPWLRYIPTLFG
ncbi:pentapeptide repeat-containing protein [Rhodovulum sulfidophilum]|uniref:Pentapeptide repeat-containing protein n=1 Tax=Rhodovulum sulfidophilum TaxID=35806 RepID=A0ABS1RVY0_RHOSU|nr:pentapeptide repeat-containing protein [Rhodovulum sulfidophilum]MBL3610196.1 pentapeptide repeat-containing protein [Rhodovulum sulfidophilum]MCE8455476.1 pentapeptide repeat-containing protein [Rhodovulum sulfidophilum]